MKKYPVQERLKIIINVLKQGIKAKEQILYDLADNGYTISPKTLERDFEQLKDFGYVIKYQRPIGYQLINDNDFKEELQEKILNTVKYNSIIAELPSLNEIMMDTATQMRGVDLLADLIDAIRNKIELKFEYHQYYGLALNNETTEARTRNVIPLWLKEHNERFYLIALPVNKTEIRTYGIDRIQKLELLNRNTKVDINQDIKKQLRTFKFMIGVTRPLFEKDKIMQVQLAVSDFLLEYWKAKPIHYTQEITAIKKNNFTCINLLLIPNIDLVKLIISGLGEIKLIGPKLLKTHIQEEYKDLIKLILN